MATIPDVGLQKVVSLVSNTFSHIGLGSTAGAITAASTQLQNEFFRLGLTEKFVDGLTIVAEIYLTEAQGNGTILQVGLFSDGTNVANSGTLMVGGDVNLTKTNTESMTISVEFTVNRK